MLGEALCDLIQRVHPVTPQFGAEIGVYKGATSQELLNRFPTTAWTFVDPWMMWPKEASYRKYHRRTGSLDQCEWDAVRAQAFNRIQFAAVGPVNILQMTGYEACQCFSGAYFDVVYIDADHTYAAVKQDIEDWLPKIKHGGVICGHDYGGTYKGVKRAVSEVFGKNIETVRSDRLWLAHV